MYDGFQTHVRIYDFIKAQIYVVTKTLSEISDLFSLNVSQCHFPKPQNQQGVPRMATFNFAEAIKTMDHEVHFANFALTSGVRLIFKGNNWRFQNFGEGHNSISKRVFWLRSRLVTTAKSLQMMSTLTENLWSWLP